MRTAPGDTITRGDTKISLSMSPLFGTGGLGRGLWGVVRGGVTP
jgi:hypothetical protein